MRAAKPNELKENAFPVITARLSEAELERWFPVPFQEITDPWATPEPSRGALVKLEAGEYVVLYWGQDSKELTVRISANVDPSAFLMSFFKRSPDTSVACFMAPPRRSVAAKYRSEARFGSGTAAWLVA